LAGAQATRSGEWREGIARVFAGADDAGKMNAAARALLAPYLDTVAAFNRGGGLHFYPGSPLIAKALLRRQDRLICPSTAGWRLKPIFRPRNGAAWSWSTRLTKTARIFFAWTRHWRSRIANGRAAFTCFGIRSKPAMPPTRWRAGCAGSTSRKYCAANYR